MGFFTDAYDLFGALLFGRVADMLGRKRNYGVEVLVLAAGATACTFSPNICWLGGAYGGRFCGSGMLNSGQR